jgi:gag-polypeptide of LTR copia-type
MSDEKAIRVIVFDGKIENWRVWKLKFVAKSTQGGYKGALDGTMTVPKESDVLDETADADKIKARKANTLAFTALCLSCEGVSFGCVEKSTTADLPNGDAALAWKNLCLKYEPNTQMSLVSLKKEFAQCRLDSVKTDPDEWVTKLEHYRMRIKGINPKAEISDEDLMVHIIANLPRQYSEFITSIENDLEQSTVTVSLDQTQVKTRMRWLCPRLRAHAAVVGRMDTNQRTVRKRVEKNRPSREEIKEIKRLTCNAVIATRKGIKKKSAGPRNVKKIKKKVATTERPKRQISRWSRLRS